jgi:uncharacterized protein with HEPN domain
MSRFSVLDHLEHMQEAASFACNHVTGLGKADFLADQKTQHAVLFNVLVLGRSRLEATEGA